MSAKSISFGSDARDRMIVGVDTLANAVKVTLGPKVEMLFWTNHLVHQELPKMVFQLQKK